MYVFCRIIFTLLLLILPVIVTGAGNKVGPKKCEISWTASPSTETAPVDGYRIYIRRPGQSQYDTTPWVDVDKSITKLKCPILTVDGQYYAKARAYNVAGESGDSNIAPFVYDKTPPARIN